MILRISGAKKIMIMILKVKGICGETLFFNPELLEFAYEITMLNKKVMYVGMKSGKKFFIDINKKDFEKIMEVTQHDN